MNSAPAQPATPRVEKTIRVLLIAPSLRILGGQSVQATRLMACLSEIPSLHMAFQPINPRLPGPLAKLPRLSASRSRLHTKVAIDRKSVV